MRINRTMHRLAGVTAAALAAVAFAAGCGDSPTGGHPADHAGPTSAGQAAADHNQADVAFAQGMIPHHQQAVEMAAMAEKNAGSAEVKALAVKIKQAQDPEIQQMTSWLTGWGSALPSASPGGHEMRGGMPGMMNDQDMKALMTASGGDFDRMFLEMMIRHHEGAIDMARTEQQQGQNPEAKALADKIAADQTAEIEKMRTLLSGK